MDIVYKFLMWFAISFPLIILMKGFIPSDVFFAFIIALIFGFLAVREGE